MKKDQKRFLYGFEGLIDRLSIHLLKEIKIPEIKEKIIKEKFDIIHDLNLDIQAKNIKLTGELIHLIIILAEVNCSIWQNESDARRGREQDLKLLKLTHGLNGIRMKISNKILELIGEKNIDKKVDCIASDWKEWDYQLIKKEN